MSTLRLNGEAFTLNGEAFTLNGADAADASVLVTFDTLIFAAAGDVLVAGDGAFTLDAPIIVAVGNVLIDVVTAVNLDTLSFVSVVQVPIDASASIVFDTLGIEALVELVTPGMNADLVVTFDSLTVAGSAYLAPAGYVPLRFDISAGRDGFSSTGSTMVDTSTSASVAALTVDTSAVYGSA